MHITCAIIDDEPLACELLKQYVSNVSFLKLEGVYNTASQAVRNIVESPVDLVFMDIQMPDVNGIELTRMLPTHTKIVFTSGYREYALDAFRVDALDYLLKPINYNEFLQAANKGLQAKEQLKTILHDDPSELHGKTAEEESASAPKSFVFVKADYKTVRIDLSDLAYIEGQKDYVRFFMLSNLSQPIQSLVSMKNIMQHLPSPNFIRVHRSYIVNTSHIDSIERGEIIVHEQHIPISDGYKPELQNFIRQNSI